MPCGNHNGVVPICFIEQNPLALEYLLALVREDSSLEVLSIQNLVDGNQDAKLKPVVIVDNCGLPLPLGECMRRLRCHHSGAKYLILDHSILEEELLRMLWMKIDGYLAYSEVPRSLLTAIHSVSEGYIWVPREILREYVQWGRELHRKGSSGLGQMTRRELQIIELVKRRLTNKEIAEILRIREATVKSHLSNIYSKLGVGSRHDLLVSNSEFLSSIIPAAAANR